MPTSPKTLSVSFKDAADFLRGVRTHLQTDRYTSHNTGAGEVREAIITDKRLANRKLYLQLKERIRDLLTYASYNVGGVDITDRVTGSGKDACASAALELVRRSYPMLQQVTVTINDIQVYQDAISTTIGTTLPEYCDTVLARIGALSTMGTVTVAGDGPRSLTTAFTKNEFGWPEIVVRSAIAKLFAANRIELRRAGKPLDAPTVARALQKKQDLDKTTVERLDEVSPEELSALRYAMRTLMANMPTLDDPKSLAAELHTFAESQVKNYRQVQSLTRIYPFSERYQNRLSELEDLVKQSNEWRWVLTVFPDKAQELREADKDLTNMSKFAKGSPMQKNYEKLRDFDRKEASEALALGVDPGIVKNIRAALAAEDCYATPAIAQTMKLMESARTQMQNALKRLRQEARASIEAIRTSYEQNYNVEGLSEEDKKRFCAIFDSYLKRADQARTKDEAIGLASELQRKETARILEIVAPKPEPPVDPDDDDDPKPPTPPKPTVFARSLVPTVWQKPVLSSEDDAREYADSLYRAIVEAIESGKIVCS